MAADFEAWLGDPGEFNRFEYIQYTRGLIPMDMPTELLYAFCETFPDRLRKWQEELSEEHGRYFLNDDGNVRYYTNEFDLDDEWKAFILFTDGKLTLLAVSCDVEHQARLRSAMADREWTLRFGDEMRGLRHKPVFEFLKLLYFYMVRHKRTCNARTFQSIFQRNMDFIMDDIQLEAVESSDEADAANIFVSGAAGTGKSVTGFRWLFMHPVKDAKRICLCYSDAQKRELEYWQESQNRINRSVNLEAVPPIKCSRWFDFLSEYAGPYIDRGFYALNPEESFYAFTEICSRLPSVYWKSIQGEEVKDKVAYLWGELHGLVKGSMFTRNTALNECEPLTRKQYGELRSFHKENADGELLTGQGINMLFQLYDRYEDYLKSNRFIDDNDVARIVIRNLDKIKNNSSFVEYQLAFLDDCQELTELQLLALFSLLSDCMQKLMAFDRCQNINPTSFHPGFIQKLADQLSQEEGDYFSLRYHLPNQYRSLLEIMRFQGSILDEIGNLYNLSDLDLKPAEFGEQDLREGFVPVWITDNSRNREALYRLFDEFGTGDIYVIHAAPLTDEERDGKHFGLTECKGISCISPVLLWNLFTEAENFMSQPQAWEYFYMGAVRPETCLFVLEPDSGTIGVFMEQLVGRGIIEKCESLEAPYAEQVSWLEEIRHRIECYTEKNELYKAYDLYLNDEYGKALSAYRQYPDNSEADLYINICRGKLAEADGDFDTALSIYLGIANESKLGYYCIQELFENPSLSPEQHFSVSVFFLNDRNYQDFCGPSGLRKLYVEYNEHDGKMELEALMNKTVSMHPALKAKIEGWTESVWKGFASLALAINDIIDKEADWRLHNE